MPTSRVYHYQAKYQHVCFTVVTNCIYFSVFSIVWAIQVTVTLTDSANQLHLRSVVTVTLTDSANQLHLRSVVTVALTDSANQPWSVQDMMCQVSPKCPN